MSLILEECIEFNDERKICVAEENGKKYNLNNPFGFTLRKVKIDKCLDRHIGEKRCDYLMDCVDLKRVIFIELKGGDLNKAVVQIYSTIVYLKNEFINYRIDARIVGSRDVPKFNNTPAYRRLAKYVIPTGGRIERATNNIYIENI